MTTIIHQGHAVKIDELDYPPPVGLLVYVRMQAVISDRLAHGHCPLCNARLLEVDLDGQPIADPLPPQTAQKTAAMSDEELMAHVLYDIGQYSADGEDGQR
jgi:hypothetical protein